MSRQTEILDKTHWDYVTEKGVSSVNSQTFPLAYKEQAIIAMDDYAKEVAIGFSEWMDKKGYTQMHNGGWQSCSDFSNKTTEQLFDLYIQSKTVKP